MHDTPPSHAEASLTFIDVGSQHSTFKFDLLSTDGKTLRVSSLFYFIFLHFSIPSTSAQHLRRSRVTATEESGETTDAARMGMCGMEPNCGGIDEHEGLSRQLGGTARPRECSWVISSPPCCQAFCCIYIYFYFQCGLHICGVCPSHVYGKLEVYVCVYVYIGSNVPRCDMRVSPAYLCVRLCVRVRRLHPLAAPQSAAFGRTPLSRCGRCPIATLPVLASLPFRDSELGLRSSSGIISLPLQAAGSPAALGLSGARTWKSEQKKTL